ncbi:MAG TPA: hypothetical protein DCG57_06895, partial [Candidatus Riflebacteria bacterium]|nr:hypothetical protein [Candidatus Riflebacteria bacterium]
MKCRIWAVLAILLVVAASDCVFAANESLLQKVMAERMSDKRLSETILGALAFLEDRQVRPRPGKLSCEFDSSDEGDGCDTRMSINIPFRENIGLPAPKQIKARNRSGEWASYIHFLPNKIGFKGRSPAAVQDSNLFMTAFIAYPLFLFDESALPPEKQHVNLMLRLAMQNIQSFKREDAYNFWAVLPGSVGKSPRTGPFNILVEQLELLGRAYINPKLAKFFAR